MSKKSTIIFYIDKGDYVIFEYFGKNCGYPRYKRKLLVIRTSFIRLLSLTLLKSCEHCPENQEILAMLFI